MSLDQRTDDPEYVLRSKFLHNAFRRLSDSFSATGPDAASVNARHDAAPAAAPGDGHGPANDFKARLSETVRHGLPNTAGKMQVVRLNRISDTLGGKWPTIQERVMQIAERVLQKRLTRVDCYSRADDRSFLVLFVELTEEQARFKAKSIADEIQAMVLGKDDGSEETDESKEGLRDVGVRTGVASVERLRLHEHATIDDLSLVLDDEMGGPEEKIGIEQRSLIGDVRIEYRPTLNVRAGYVSIFECVPSRRNDGRVWKGNSFYPGGNGEINLRMNLEVICRALVDVHQALAAGQKFVAVLPVHFQAISSRHRNNLIEALRTIDLKARQALTFDICGCPPGTPSVRVSEVVSALAPFGRAVTMRVGLNDPEIETFSNLGLTSMGIDVGEKEFDGAMMNRLTAFVRRVRTMGLQTYVFGVRSADMIGPLAELGVDYINGPAVALATQTLGAITPYTRKLPAARPIKDLVSVAGTTPSNWVVTKAALDRPSDG